MKIIDRYLARMFAKIFLICFMSLTGLFIIVDVFSNLEEFIGLSNNAESLLQLLWEYYFPRVFDFFDRTAPLLALVAAIGSLVWMQRANEIVAIEAGGISRSRLLRPLVYGMLILVVFSIFNREWVLPQYRLALARNAQSWSGNEGRAILPQEDQLTGIWFMGGKVTVAQRRIDRPELQLPPSCESFANRVIAEAADEVDADDRHPRGFIFRKVIEPQNLNAAPSVHDQSKPVVITPADANWLKTDELFVSSEISLNDLAFGQEIQKYASLPEQMAGLRNPSKWFSNRHRVQVHGRILRPILDLAIVLIGVPIVISRRERNVFVAFALCLVVVIGIQMFIVACHYLGASRIINPAAFAAWLPVIVLVPLAVLAVDQMDL